MIRKILGKNARIDIKRKIAQIVLRGKAILPFLRRYLQWSGKRTHTIHFKKCVLSMPDSFLRGILRGLIAGDGGVYEPRARVSFGVVSRSLAYQYAGLLDRFGIPSHMYSVPYRGKRTLYHVTVTGKANLRKFKLRVGLTDPAKKKLLDLALRR